MIYRVIRATLTFASVLTFESFVIFKAGEEKRASFVDFMHRLDILLKFVAMDNIQTHTHTQSVSSLRNTYDTSNFPLRSTLYVTVNMHYPEKNLSKFEM